MSADARPLGREHTILLIHYGFPPAGSLGTGIRHLKFIKYLSRLGWRFVVMCVTPDSAAGVSGSGAEHLLQEIPSSVVVERIRCPQFFSSFFDARCDPSLPGDGPIRERLWIGARLCLRRLARRLHVGVLFSFPDSQATWIYRAYPRGLKLIKRYQVDVIIATPPPPSVCLLGLLLSRSTKKPLVLDIRDDWVEYQSFSQRPRIVQVALRQFDRLVVRGSERVVTVTQPSLEGFRRRHPSEPARKFVLIPNGADLEEYEFLSNCKPDRDSRKFRIVSAGILAPGYSDPNTFFRGVAQATRQCPSLMEDLEVLFVGDGLHKHYGALLEQLDLSTVVHEVPPLVRQEFIKLIASADLLLLIQARNLPTSVAGTVYEYWAVGGPPVLMVGDPGALWSVVEHYRLGINVRADSIDEIGDAVLRVYEAHKAGTPIRISQQGIEQHDRKVLASRLHSVLAEVVPGGDSGDKSNVYCLDTSRC